MKAREPLFRCRQIYQSFALWLALCRSYLRSPFPTQDLFSYTHICYTPQMGFHLCSLARMSDLYTLQHTALTRHQCLPFANQDGPSQPWPLLTCPLKASVAALVPAPLGPFSPPLARFSLRFHFTQPIIDIFFKILNLADASNSNTRFSSLFHILASHPLTQNWGVGLVTCSPSASTFIHLLVLPHGPSLTSALCIPTAPLCSNIHLSLLFCCQGGLLAIPAYLLTALSSIFYSHARVGWRMNLRREFLTHCHHHHHC